MSDGFLMSFEGGEGGGKSTQVARLVEHFQKMNRPVMALREPGGTGISEQIREVVLGNKNTGLSFPTEVLLFQAARAQLYSEVVIPNLAQGTVILMDRTRDSSVVYQGVVRGFGKALIEQLNDISTQKTVPNLTFLLDVPVEVGLSRRAQTGEQNRLDLEKKDFHEQVRAAYLDLAKSDTTGRWVIINAEKSLDEVEAEIWQILEQRGIAK
jgi:dTMP kinase